MALCAAGSLQLWARLSLIADLARTINLSPGTDWQALFARARDAGAARMLRLGLHLAADLLDAAVPADLRRELAADPLIAAQARRIEAGLVDGAGGRMSETGRMRLRLGLRERLSDRLRYITRFSFTPTVEDWKALPLPDALFTLYTLLRPLRLLGEVAAARLGREKNAPFFATPMPLVERMLAMAEITPQDVVYELGCGDGRMVIAAARLYGARGLGVDLDPGLVEESRRNAVEAGVQDRVTFAVEDVMNVDLRPATVVLVWLLPGQQLQLRRKLEQELAPGTRIVGHSFDMGDWVPTEVEIVEVAAWGRESQIAYLWTMGGPGANGAHPS
jgi:SAM-dependent methyltransferase